MSVPPFAPMLGDELMSVKFLIAPNARVEIDLSSGVVAPRSTSPNDLGKIWPASAGRA
jgi:hypothetical protein